MTAHPHLFWRLTIIFVGAWMFGGCGLEKDGSPTAKSRSTGSESTTSERPVDFLAQARRMLKIGDLESAAEAAYKALLQGPDSADAKLIASEIEAARGNHQASVDLASSIDIRSRLGHRATDIRSRQLVQLNRPSEAADVILAAIKLVPIDDARVVQLRRQAWKLLSRVGRRQEASQQARRLCRTGQANRSELLSLARPNDAFPIMLETGRSPEYYFEPGLGIARWYFTEREHRRALEELSGQRDAGFESPAACALYGRILAETQTLEAMPTWYAGCGEEVRKFSDYWVALGTYFLDQHQYEASARALLEAVTRDPTDYGCTNRLAKVFEALGHIEKSKQFRDRAALIFQVESVTMKSRRPGKATQPDGAQRLLLELGRPFEALGWTMVTLPETDVDARAAVAQKLAQLNRDHNAIEMASQMSLVGIDPTQFSLEPALELLRQPSPPKTHLATHTDQLAVPRLVNVADQLGLEFQWYQDVESNLTSIPLHELMGGGIAIIDYDLDGWPDVYMAQGAGKPPTDACTLSNMMFRNVGARFEAVTSSAGADDFNYSSGLAAGDVNQDGFMDLLLGSLGRNRLLINNGDGTFRDATGSWGGIEDRYTSSLAIADVNGDALPDLFEAIYVEMDGGFDEPKIGDDGFPRQPSPVMHYAQSDRWFENMGDGTFQRREITREVARPGTSLGVVVTDFDNNGSNEVFVGNDARTNHFLVQAGNNAFANIAGIKGVAAGFSGASDACMGIATGDFDRNGSIDMHITNYSDESANHYLQSYGGAFTDMASRYGIDAYTLRYIGFGAKAVDVDRNGWLDLIVTNGHVFDRRMDGDEFQMPPQFLASEGDRFELASVDDDSGYWEGVYLGRSIAMTDFDRDGAIDFLIGHLHHPLALLHNQTRTRGHSIQFELIGTVCERDAIGAHITVTMAGGPQFSQWVTAGDGYLCSDEPMVDFGLGDLREIDRVEVAWPSGATQIFDNLQPGRRYLIVEGEATVHRR